LLSAGSVTADQVSAHKPVDQRRDVRWLHREAYCELPKRGCALFDEGQCAVLVLGQTEVGEGEFHHLGEAHHDLGS